MPKFIFSNIVVRENKIHLKIKKHFDYVFLTLIVIFWGVSRRCSNKFLHDQNKPFTFFNNDGNAEGRFVRNFEILHQFDANICISCFKGMLFFVEKLVYHTVRTTYKNRKKYFPSMAWMINLELGCFFENFISHDGIAKKYLIIKAEETARMQKKRKERNIITKWLMHKYLQALLMQAFQLVVFNNHIFFFNTKKVER